MKKVIGITGGTGFVGRHITRLLRQEGHEVIIFTRTPRAGSEGITYADWNPDKRTINTAALSKVEAIMHLAGASVTEKRWTTKYKDEIVRSRVDATLFLHEQIGLFAPRCVAFVAASATGFYGPDRSGASMPFQEDDAPYNDFLARVCLQWETATFSAGIKYRSVALRIGIVLGRDGGAYPELAGPMGFGIVPILGSGQQMVSWIHVDDLAAVFVKATTTAGFSGVYNAVAPQPVTHRSLMMAIANAKGRLKIPVPVPPFVLSIMLGGASVEVLKSCTVSDKKVRDAGFEFAYPDIESAVKELVNAAR